MLKLRQFTGGWLVVNKNDSMYGYDKELQKHLTQYVHGPK